MPSPYPEYIAQIAAIVDQMRGAYPVETAPAPRPALAADAPVALVLSPHPDDECIIGGWALRLLRESGYRVVNVAITQGSAKDRQLARAEELRGACDFLGFELVQFGDRGLESINPKGREANHTAWCHSVDALGAVIADHQPEVVFMPHLHDWNQTHIGTHLLGVDALTLMPLDYTCRVVETEYWGAMADPNMMVESSASDLADLLTALSFHVGEISRNPYHIRVAPWMIDNVRRGAEVVGGQGGAAPDFTFATLYRLREWRNRQLEAIDITSPFIAATDDPAALLKA